MNVVAYLGWLNRWQVRSASGLSGRLICVGGWGAAWLAPLLLALSTAAGLLLLLLVVVVVVLCGLVGVVGCTGLAVQGNRVLARPLAATALRS